MDPDGRAEVPKLYQNCPAQQKVDYYVNKCLELKQSIQKTETKIDSLKLEKKELFNTRLDAYKDAFFTIGETFITLLQITNGGDATVNDFSVQDIAEFVADFDSSDYVSLSPKQLIKDDMNYISDSFKINTKIYDEKFKLKRLYKEFNTAYQDLKQAYILLLKENLE